eukprot:TRINITY_DN9301_c0_g1_i3.p1 TRINITY_DN9301_c0_g1~~TRINITY_DN9301_c0_g1_i3.p1  ORF type:complete len:279 (-),score=69.57 TRINITY_DN9301_c0_g1_i3:36-872(-)
MLQTKKTGNAELAKMGFVTVSGGVERDEDYTSLNEVKRDRRTIEEMHLDLRKSTTHEPEPKPRPADATAHELEQKRKHAEMFGSSSSDDDQEDVPIMARVNKPLPGLSTGADKAAGGLPEHKFGGSLPKHEDEFLQWLAEVNQGPVKALMVQLDDRGPKMTITIGYLDLYRRIDKLGGFARVCADRGWSRVNSDYGVARSSPTIKKKYSLHVLPFEDLRRSIKRARQPPAQQPEFPKPTPTLSPKRLSLIHISEPTRLLSISYAVFCLKKKKKITKNN